MVAILLSVFISLIIAQVVNTATENPGEVLFTSKPLNFYSPQLLPAGPRENNLPQNDIFNLRSFALPNRIQKYKFNENATSDTSTSTSTESSTTSNGTQDKTSTNDKDGKDKINFNIKVVPPFNQNYQQGQYVNQRPTQNNPNPNSGNPGYNNIKYVVNYVQPNGQNSDNYGQNTQDTVTNNPFFGFTIPSQYSTEVSKDGNTYKWVLYV